MSDFLIALAFFVALAGASLLTLFTNTKFPSWHSNADTRDVVRLCAGLFVVMTSLVLGLMINSAKNTFESVDKNVHAYATELIVLDRNLRQYGPDAAAVRQQLLAYVKQAAARMAQSDPVLGSRAAENLLNNVADGLHGLKPTNTEQAAIRTSAEHRFATVFEMRWALVEQSGRTIPAPLIVLLAAWLALIFANFGYCAPRNPVVVAILVISSLLIASAIYLILDLDSPFDGTIQVSAAPLERAVAEMEH